MTKFKYLFDFKNILYILLTIFFPEIQPEGFYMIDFINTLHFQLFHLTIKDENKNRIQFLSVNILLQQDGSDESGGKTSEKTYQVEPLDQGKYRI